ncbi:hypothetical protein ACFYOT_23640 [Saccharothrix saharensis]|uniref:hypothetical protein n=1 Tax=Saccharothrix saharensis TaxID=571190 RepID=UPI0036815CD0
MLRITVDVFSGRPNPVWELQDEARAREALRVLGREAELFTSAAPRIGRLGLRGLVVEAVEDDIVGDLRAGSYLAVGADAAGARATELAERLISLVRQGGTPLDVGDDFPGTGLLDLLVSELGRVDGEGVRRAATTGVDGDAPKAQASPSTLCMVESAKFNPDFWNDDENIRLNNNCYNYASNRVTNTFAQPGRGAGKVIKNVACPDVGNAALADGMHQQGDCLPDSEKPRWFTALVIAPGFDYHWYRHQIEKFWGHKPAGTDATNLDNSGNVIHDPETADRGPYTDFCGYFYGGKTQRSRIR